VLNCLPADGGLYIPEQTPDLRGVFGGLDESTSYAELCSGLAWGLLEGELSREQAARFGERTFPFSPSLVRVDEHLSILKLFTGPSGSIKDFGLAFLAGLLDELNYARPGDSLPVLTLCAAHPDTTAAITRAFHNQKDNACVIIFPRGNIYGVAENELLSNGGNIIPIQIDGTLDDCTRILRELLLDKQFTARYHVTSANGMNIGRLLPQAFYFIWAFLQ
jgi:threonine synthase